MTAEREMDSTVKRRIPSVRGSPREFTEGIPVRRSSQVSDIVLRPNLNDSDDASTRDRPIDVDRGVRRSAATRNAFGGNRLGARRSSARALRRGAQRYAFFAHIGPRDSGVFTGSNPATDKVLQTGDLYRGVPVTSVFTCSEALNNLGQIVMTVRSENPDTFEVRTFIVKATPIRNNE
jgi:hypothetical protein